MNVCIFGAYDPCLTTAFKSNISAVGFLPRHSKYSIVEALPRYESHLDIINITQGTKKSVVDKQIILQIIFNQGIYGLLEFNDK
jgi:hypothetical protein